MQLLCEKLLIVSSVKCVNHQIISIRDDLFETFRGRHKGVIEAEEVQLTSDSLHRLRNCIPCNISQPVYGFTNYYICLSVFLCPCCISLKETNLWILHSFEFHSVWMTCLSKFSMLESMTTHLDLLDVCMWSLFYMTKQRHACLSDRNISKVHLTDTLPSKNI